MGASRVGEGPIQAKEGPGTEQSLTSSNMLLL
ncbi:hypothetical protein PC118_g8292 [Phytophthora cactorum]|uniref:Uncharacterized protein n=1 Tax=Phytophthora cactorum TaxID=29920 RepID=A0A8T0ZA97_9STRA|nr:hypothetical protein PC112_g9371 [Phytophthora cactorum]KAG2835057.1 hypothetical protein PC111_g5601 [Phytophthora cactorum]KAG2859524.1 hypothetical protein PC113_g8861 [Phytophthora cactorum]KAG2985545.1 hypothetical protein PC118_g8292 [Phytophthora cactorum]